MSKLKPKDIRTRWFPYITAAQRDSYFGPLIAVPAPTVNDPDAVRIVNDYEANKIVKAHFPELATVPGAHGGDVWMHKDAAKSLALVLQDLDKRGLTRYIEEFNGAWVPRFVRKVDGTHSPNLSSHSYGTAIDINAHTNGQGKEPTTRQIEIARVFAAHGWFWGDWFLPDTISDPMHFEYITKG